MGWVHEDITKKEGGTVHPEIDTRIPAEISHLKRVLVFSPDEDLARFLLLNLEDRFSIIREHRIEFFEETIRMNFPDLILIDLFSLSGDIVKQLEIVQKWKGSIPVIVLRAYKSVTSEIDKSIDYLSRSVFYKPVNGELITQAIEDLLK